MLARAGAISTRPDGEIAALGLVAGGYRLTEMQAQAILEMRLNRLTGLEQDKIIAEFQELLVQIRDLSDILARPERLLAGNPHGAGRHPRDFRRQTPHRDPRQS